MKKIIGISLVVAFALGIFSISVDLVDASVVDYGDGCTATSAYSVTTGKQCNVDSTVGCKAGYLFSPITGAPCSAPTLPPGCLPGYIFSYLSGARCTPYPTPHPIPSVQISPITIEGVSGPLALDVNAQGRWKVKASSDENGRDLSYSVRWGDEYVTYNDSIAGALAYVIQQSATFTHTYTQPGIFYPTFTVSNDYGSESTSISVNVGKTTAGEYDDFARYLKKSGAVLYGAFWSPHVESQKKLFGSSAVYLPYVECSTADSSGQTRICLDKGIPAYPTWEFSDGSRLTGVISLERLAEKVSYDLDQDTSATLTVLAPNGGETWKIGSTQKALWEDKNGTTCPYPTANSSSFVACTSPTYDVTLEGASSCRGDVCTMGFTVYNLTKRATNPFYWSVGFDINGNKIPAGSYRIKVCRTESSTCDEGNDYFNIVSDSGGTNKAPEITSGSSPEGVVTGKEYEFSWKAQDENKDTLSWWTNWGDGAASGGGCNTAYSTYADYSKSWNYSASHSWTNPGTYIVSTTATDCRGGSNTSSVYVTVGQGTLPPASTGSVQGAEAFNFTQRLELGMEGNEVKELQKYLTQKGYYRGDIDGKFGIQTQKALVSFQITNGLSVDGVVGAAVRAILNK